MRYSSARTRCASHLAANALQETMEAFLVRAASAQARTVGKLNYITVSMDDALARKHKHTRQLV